MPKLRVCFVALASGLSHYPLKTKDAPTKAGPHVPPFLNTSLGEPHSTARDIPALKECQGITGSLEERLQKCVDYFKRMVETQAFKTNSLGLKIQLQQANHQRKLQEQDAKWDLVMSNTLEAQDLARKTAAFEAQFLYDTENKVVVQGAPAFESLAEKRWKLVHEKGNALSIDQPAPRAAANAWEASLAEKYMELQSQIESRTALSSYLFNSVKGNQDLEEQMIKRVLGLTSASLTLLQSALSENQVSRSDLQEMVAYVIAKTKELTRKVRVNGQFFRNALANFEASRRKRGAGESLQLLEETNARSTGVVGAVSAQYEQNRRLNRLRLEQLREEIQTESKAAQQAVAAAQERNRRFLFEKLELLQDQAKQFQTRGAPADPGLLRSLDGLRQSLLENFHTLEAGFAETKAGLLGSVASLNGQTDRINRANEMDLRPKANENMELTLKEMLTQDEEVEQRRLKQMLENRDRQSLRAASETQEAMKQSLDFVTAEQRSSVEGGFAQENLSLQEAGALDQLAMSMQNTERKALKSTLDTDDQKLAVENLTSQQRGLSQRMRRLLAHKAREIAALKDRMLSHQNRYYKALAQWQREALQRNQENTRETQGQTKTMEKDQADKLYRFKAAIDSFNFRAALKEEQLARLRATFDKLQKAMTGSQKQLNASIDERLKAQATNLEKLMEQEKQVFQQNLKDTHQIYQEEAKLLAESESLVSKLNKEAFAQYQECGAADTKAIKEALEQAEILRKQEFQMAKSFFAQVFEAAKAQGEAWISGILLDLPKYAQIVENWVSRHKKLLKFRNDSHQEDMDYGTETRKIEAQKEAEFARAQEAKIQRLQATAEKQQALEESNRSSVLAMINRVKDKANAMLKALVSTETVRVKMAETTNNQMFEKLTQDLSQLSKSTSGQQNALIQATREATKKLKQETTNDVNAVNQKQSQFSAHTQANMATLNADLQVADMGAPPVAKDPVQAFEDMINR